MAGNKVPEELHPSSRAGLAGRGPAQQRLFAILRYAMSLALIGVLFAFVDLDATLALMLAVDLRLLLLVLLLELLDRVLHGWRWVLLLNAKLNDIPARVMFRVHFISNFLANFLPFNVGNDVTRVVSLAKYSGSTIIEPLSSVILDRVIGFAALLVTAILVVAAAVIWQVSAIGPGLASTFLAVLAILVLLGLGFWKGGLFDKGVSLLKDRTSWRWTHWVTEIYEACVSYRLHRRAVGAVFIVVQITVIIGILTTYLTGMSLGMHVPLIYFVMFVPLISFLSSLPISANGIGIAEGGFVFFFSQVGASAAEALTLALVMRVLMIIATLPGAVLLAVQGWPVRPEATTTSTGP